MDYSERHLQTAEHVTAYFCKHARDVRNLEQRVVMNGDFRDFGSSGKRLFPRELDCWKNVFQSFHQSFFPSIGHRV